MYDEYLRNINAKTISFALMVVGLVLTFTGMPVLGVLLAVASLFIPIKK